MDTFHTEDIAESPVIKDLLDRIVAIAAVAIDPVRGAAEPKARDEAFPIDLLSLAAHYESEAGWSSLHQDEDDRVRYYGFWRLFRAAAIRGVRMLNGDDSHDNRSRMADAYVQLSAIMLDSEHQDDRVVLTGDLDFAEQCAVSACNLIRDGDPAADYFRRRAEQQLETVFAVRSAVETNPDRFILRPRYGPFQVRSAAAR